LDKNSQIETKYYSGESFTVQILDLPLNRAADSGGAGKERKRVSLPGVGEWQRQTDSCASAFCDASLYPACHTLHPERYANTYYAVRGKVAAWLWLWYATPCPCHSDSDSGLDCCVRPAGRKWKQPSLHCNADASFLPVMRERERMAPSARTVLYCMLCD
jgi:hypothetical protein